MIDVAIIFILWSVVGFFVFMLVGSIISDADQIEVQIAFTKESLRKNAVFLVCVFLGGPLLWVVALHAGE